MDSGVSCYELLTYPSLLDWPVEISIIVYASTIHFLSVSCSPNLWWIRLGYMRVNTVCFVESAIAFCWHYVGLPQTRATIFMDVDHLENWVS